jgi:hypothetical protein
LLGGVVLRRVLVVVWVVTVRLILIVVAQLPSISTTHSNDQVRHVGFEVDWVLSKSMNGIVSP